MSGKSLFPDFSSKLSIKMPKINKEYSCKGMPTSKKTKITKSMFITDTRPEQDEHTYVYEFYESMVPPRAWEALMVLEAKGKFHFPNVGDCGYHDLVGDCGYHDLVGDCGYHDLVDNVKDRKTRDEDFQEFFDLAMEDKHDWPRKGSTREESMKQLACCSWVVSLVEE